MRTRCSPAAQRGLDLMFGTHLLAWRLDVTGPAAQVSYMILQRVSPVTHSIGNCLKRIIVIVASVIFFKNPMSQQNMIGERCGAPPCVCPSFANARCVAANADVHRCQHHYEGRFTLQLKDLTCTAPAGTAVALAGVFLYSQVKRFSKPKKLA